ncbi:MAG: T9SS type A sorting domain-containing protein [Psychroserpens sp.]|uniref:T9SS type A sorting domain-containing protein n=1 Tax=Psychroserpens sp. TaxID=2020870 RepID=UPI003002D033
MKRVIFLGFLFIHITCFAQWEQVGSNFGYTGGARVGDIVFHPVTNEPYIAYPQSGYRIDKFDGTDWIQTGVNLGFSYSNAGVSLTFDPSSNEPYVAFNNNIFNEFKTNRFDGSNWIETGTFTLANFISEIDVAFNPSTNEPYLAFPLESGTFDELVVVKFSNGNWVDVGSALATFQYTGRPSIAFNPNTNEPYVAYTWGANFVAVKKFDGVNWVSTGPITGTPGELSNVSLAFNPSTNEPYIAFVDRANNENKYVIQKFDGANWTQVGSNPGSSFGTGTINLDFNPMTSEPHIAYPDDVLGSYIVQKFDGSNWTQVGNGVAGSFIGSECKIDFNPITNEPYVNYFDSGLNSLIVQKFNDNSLGLDSSISLLDQTVLYPNPSNGQIILNFKNTFEEIDIKVFDLSGKLIHSQNNKNAVNELKVNLNLSENIYFIEITSGKQKVVKKLIISY